MTDITTQWERIEAAFEDKGLSEALHAGASAQDIDQLESDLGLTLPADLRESLTRHDGSDEGSWPFGGLLGVHGIKVEVGIWRGLLDGGDFDHAADFDASGGSGETQKGWWHQGWVSLDADGGGNGHIVDTAPGPNGTVGQVLYMDHEIGPSAPRFVSVLEYLTHIADRIESGKFVWQYGCWEEY